MGRDRLVQLVSAAVVIGAILGCVALMPTIKDQRADLRPNVDAAGLPPKYALINTLAGPFRGLFVDWLYYRAERLKRQNKLYEVNTLTRWITTLQPRFPAVWADRAWNLSYNLSVKTDTEEERWDWVQKGVRLLREEGIPHNPKALYLYRELGRIFWHKIGMSSDDMHYYYKQRMAERWQKVLGEVTLAETKQQSLDRLTPIVQMAEVYFMTDEPPAAMRDRLNALAEQYPDYAEPLNGLKRMDLAKARHTLSDWRQHWDDAPPKLTAAVNSMYREVCRLSSGNPIGRFKQAHPKAGRLLTDLQAAGLTIDTPGLEHLGSLLMRRHYATDGQIDQHQDEWLPKVERALWPVVKSHAGTEPWQHVMAFLRAGVLVREYNMDPRYMQTMVERYGPLDWRHPASHAIYWASRGLEMARSIRKGGSLDRLNMQRQVIHGLQMLFQESGRMSYSVTDMKTLEGKVRGLPGVAFADSYLKAVETYERERAEGQGKPFSRGTFDAGKENFLKYVIELTYLYGDQSEARRRYRELRDEYGQTPQGRLKQAYQVPFDVFISRRLRERVGEDRHSTIRMVSGLLRRAILQGLATGDKQMFNRLTSSAHAVHQAYATRSNQYQAPTAEQGRLTLDPFPAMFERTYDDIMQSSSLSLLERRRIYANTPADLKQNVTVPAGVEQAGDQSDGGP